MLVHYVIVRRDLPLGVTAAMLVHAAGESSPHYTSKTGEPFEHAVAVVLEAKSEKDLDRIEEYLYSNQVIHVNVHETGGPYDGQFMAIGCVPAERTPELTQIMEPLQTLKTLDIPNAGL
jgi:hypothetical protein